jgi:hypothetical protein
LLTLPKIIKEAACQIAANGLVKFLPFPAQDKKAPGSIALHESLEPMGFLWKDTWIML